MRVESAGLKAAGISSTTPEPPGAVIERETDSGGPNGILYEMNYMVDRVMPAPRPAEFDNAVKQANRTYLSFGIASLQDAALDNSPSRLRAFRRLRERGTWKSSGGQFVLRDERISSLQALSMYTANAAYTSFEDGVKGSIARGKLADLVALSADPTTVSEEEIWHIKVELTVLGGEVVWET